MKRHYVWTPDGMVQVTASSPAWLGAAASLGRQGEIGMIAGFVGVSPRPEDPGMRELREACEQNGRMVCRGVIDRGESMEWSEHDPRDHKGKRGTIEIVIWTGDSLCTGEVETEHGYHVMYSARIILPVTEPRKAGMIGPGDDWPKDWKWIRAPE